VAQRPPHLPRNIERTALQKMRASQWLPAISLHPAGEPTIAGMVAKGWIERQLDGSDVMYRITPLGEAALKEKIPISP
jgi:hypothetical protein